MRIEITSTQAGRQSAVTARAATSRVTENPPRRAALVHSSLDTPLAVQSVAQDPLRPKPGAPVTPPGRANRCAKTIGHSLSAAAFGTGVAMPVPVRWDAVRQ